MTQEQEELAEQLIEMHKAKKGLLYFTQAELIRWPHGNDRAVVYGMLKDFGIIQQEGNGATRLTKYGNEFPGFPEYRRRKQQEEDQEDLIRDLTVDQLKKDIFQLRNWWWILLINILLSGLTSWLVAVFSE